MLWNDICRYPREMQAVSVLSQSQLAARRYLEHQQVAGYPARAASNRWSTVGLQLVPSDREAEEALSGAFTITLWGMVKKRKRSYGSIWQTVFVSFRLCLSPFISVSLTTEDWDYERYILISKNYDSIIYNFSSSWIYNTQNHMVLWNW